MANKSTGTGAAHNAAIVMAPVSADRAALIRSLERKVEKQEAHLNAAREALALAKKGN